MSNSKTVILIKQNVIGLVGPNKSSNESVGNMISEINTRFTSISFADKVGNTRNIADKDIWLDAVVPKDYNKPKIVITDVKYLCEAQRIKDVRGILIYICLPNTESSNEEENLAETKSLCDFTLTNDGTMEDLRQNLIKIIGRALIL